MKLTAFIQGDALEILSLLPNDTFAGIVTSPPYNLGDRTPPANPNGKTHPINPPSGSALQRFPRLSGVFQGGNALVHKSVNAPRRLRA